MPDEKFANDSATNALTPVVTQRGGGPGGALSAPPSSPRPISRAPAPPPPAAPTVTKMANEMMSAFANALRGRFPL